MRSVVMIILQILRGFTLFVYSYSSTLGYRARSQYGKINQYKAIKDE